MKPYLFHPDARIEYRAEIEYLEYERAGYGAVFGAMVEKLIRAICGNPQLFPKKRNGARYCYMGLFRYNIWFYERENDIVILAIAHTRRKPGYWRYRLGEVR